MAVVRWQPGARERLRTAALDLYLSRGFEQTTVAEIAESVGLTERTFFRHFADKREVLFDGQDLLQQALLAGVAGAADGADALELVACALAGSTQFFPDERRGYSWRRQQIIAANPGLQERELLKLATLASAIGQALRSRGVSEPTASIAAESAVTLFTVAFAQWIDPAESQSLEEIEQAGLAALKALTR